jgi:hypothetical protein
MVEITKRDSTASPTKTQKLDKELTVAEKPNLLVSLFFQVVFISKRISASNSQKNHQCRKCFDFFTGSPVVPELTGKF